MSSSHRPRSPRFANSRLLALAVMIAASHGLAAAQQDQQSTYPIPPAVPSDTIASINASLSPSYTSGDGGKPNATAAGAPTGTFLASGTDSPPASGTGGSWPGAAGGQGGAAGGWPGAGAGGAGGQWPGAGGAGGMGGGMGGWQRPEWVDVLPHVRIAHAVLGTVTVMFVFPFGGILLRLWDHCHSVWVHAAIQMVGYLLFLCTAAMGLWMGAVEKKLGGYHPIMGMVILALLTIQPFTELMNHFLFQRFPKIRVVGYGHIWVGRILIAAGLIHGGLGFTYSAKIDREMPMRPGPYPLGVHVTYGVLAGLVLAAYTAALVWKQTQNLRRMSVGSQEEEMAQAEAEGPLSYRVEEHPLSVVLASVRRASESVPETGNNGSNNVGTAVAPLETQGSSSALGDPAVIPKATPSRMSSVKRIFKSDAL